MTSKQRAYLKSLAMKIDPVFRVGKDSISPELIEGVREAIDARELIKIAVLQNCMDDEENRNSWRDIQPDPSRTSDPGADCP